MKHPKNGNVGALKYVIPFPVRQDTLIGKTKRFSEELELGKEKIQHCEIFKQFGVSVKEFNIISMEDLL